ncbi:MAG: antibiotic biosynthesis monooxygenase [Micrococcales bacterium]|nr:antibiotic biosynthesis monooxygenase [Micrococcales bacterium]
MSIKVVAETFVRPDAVDEFLAVAAQLRAATHEKDAGCVAYDLFRDTADPLHLTMIEEWETKEALDAHIASDHFQRLFPGFAKASEPGKPGVITIYEPVS